MPDKIVKQPARSSLSEALKNPWAKLTGAILSITAIFGIGYSVGQFKEEIDWKIEQAKMIQEYNEKIQAEKDRCRSEELANTKEKIDELKQVVNEIKNRQ